MRVVKKAMARLRKGQVRMASRRGSRGAVGGGVCSWGVLWVGVGVSEWRSGGRGGGGGGGSWRSRLRRVGVLGREYMRVVKKAMARLRKGQVRMASRRGSRLLSWV